MNPQAIISELIEGKVSSKEEADKKRAEAIYAKQQDHEYWLDNAHTKLKLEELQNSLSSLHHRLIIEGQDTTQEDRSIRLLLLQYINLYQTIEDLTNA